jgi:PAS domain S-box-containing protein
MKVIESGVPVWRSIEKWTRGSETRYSSVDKVPLRGVDDVVSNVVVLAYEITPQVEAETQFRKLNEQLELRVALRTDELGAANAALRASEERTLSILQNALDAVVMMDREGFVTGWNQAAERVFGYSSSEAIGREVAELIIPREGRAAHRVGLNAAKETGIGPVIGRLIEVTAMRKSGESFPAEISITRMGSGMSMGFTAFVRDISERKDAEIRILDLNHQLGLRVEEAGAANRELEAFCYSVSHDLRTPLRSIDGFSLALLEDYGHVIDATGKDYMVRVRNATQRMAGLIDDLLNLSRVSRAELNREAVDLSIMAAGICAELKLANPGRNVVCEITPGLTVTADPALVRIVLENLLGNAWKYTSRKAEARVELGMQREHNREIYYVKDNGAGFDMTYADKLFAPFQRLHRADEFEGTGVGLATVLRILHRHGGHAWAEASVDRGATVFFTL